MFVEITLDPCVHLVCSRATLHIIEEPEKDSGLRHVVRNEMECQRVLGRKSDKYQRGGQG